MKAIIIVVSLILFLIILIFQGCSSEKVSDWDSGSKSNEGYQIQRMEENSENVQNQFPTVSPGTERDQPF